MLHLKTWWDTAAVLAVIWLSGLTHARLEMWMKPEDKNVYYVEEGGPKSIQCIVLVDKSVTVNLKWSGPSIDASKPQRVSNIPQENYELVGNWLNITHFSNTTAGEYKCRALTSASPPNDLTQTIRLVKGCDVGTFSPPSCRENCSSYCRPRPKGPKGRSCDHINGTCLYGCWGGHTGSKCTECDVGRFKPPPCNESCSTYCKSRPDGATGRNCDHINGTCLFGCQEGYKMPFCTEETDGPGGIIGGVIGGVICLTVIVIIVVLVFRKKTGSKHKGNEDSGEATPLTATCGYSSGTGKEDDTEQNNIIRNLKNQNRQLKDENKQKDSTISNLKNRIKQLIDEKRQMELDKGAMSLAHERTQAEMECLKETREELRAKLEKRKEDKRKSRAQKEELIRQKAFLEGRVQEMSPNKNDPEIQAQLIKVNAEMPRVEEECKEKTSKKYEVQEKYEEINAALYVLSTSFLTIKDEINQKNEEKEKAGKGIETLKQQMENKDEQNQAETENLTTAIDSLTEENEKELQKCKEREEAQAKKLTEEIDQENMEKTETDIKIATLKGQLKERYEEHRKTLENEEKIKMQLVEFTDELRKKIRPRSRTNDEEELKEQMESKEEPEAIGSYKTDNEGLSEEKTRPGAEIPPSINLQAQSFFTLKRGIWTTIKEYSKSATDNGGHFDQHTGYFTVPRDGMYDVTFSADKERGHLYLHQLKDSDKSDTSIYDNRESQFDKDLGLCESTLMCSLCKNDCLYLKGVSGLTYGMDVTVRFSVSYLG